MSDNSQAVEVPAEVLSSPALLFLYYRIEQILGIKAGCEALTNLNEHLEKNCGASFIENPAAFETLLASREQIYEISKFLTVNETYFFREGVHFELLSNLLPQLVKLNRPIQICSAAASTGCEAYSIAMLLDYYAKKGPDFDFMVDAFDVNAEAVKTAIDARYTSNTLRSDGSVWKYILDLYLVPENNGYAVTQNIRKKVRFFLHNIMRGLDRQYDIIFFRNALIYFSPGNRLTVLNNLAEALFDNGFLFLGISETSSAHHPLLAGRYSSDVFYFQKAAVTGFPRQPEQEKTRISRTHAKTAHNVRAEKNIRNDAAKPALPKHEELQITSTEIAAILETEEGRPNAKKVPQTLAGEMAELLGGSELAACVVYFLSIQDFNSADFVLSYLEKCNSGAFTRFLRGEYFFLQGKAGEAEYYFKEAAIKNKVFWPAFYRIAALAAEGNRTRYEYKIKKAIESIETGKQMRYECFMGGFSPDYFRLILEKKLT